MKNFTFICLSFLLWSCGNSLTGTKYDLTGFNTEKLGGGGVLASYYGPGQSILSKGTTLQGIKNGAWMTYFPETAKIQTLNNYVNGKKNGIELELNDRGQIIAMTEFKNDELHGLSAKYRFGRPLEETNYKEGKMHGPFAIYDDNGKIQRRGSFNNGKQDGILQYYDEQGNVTLEYVYKNGEKISGGIVNNQESTESSE